MPTIRFSLRSLLIVTALAVVFMRPALNGAAWLVEYWNRPTVVTVPAGGIVIMGSRRTYLFPSKPKQPRPSDRIQRADGSYYTVK